MHALSYLMCTPRDLDEVMKHTLHGKVNEILQGKQKISTEDICEPVEHDCLSLVFIEGPPGIGKSTLAWELCRRWKDIPSMRQYNLVVLLRLRENYTNIILNTKFGNNFCGNSAGMIWSSFTRCS